MAQFGDIAQLVEQCFCIAKVSGSNPLISKEKFKVFFNKNRIKFLK